MCKNTINYNPKETGKRIKSCRKEIAKSQDLFLMRYQDKLGIGRSSLSKCENGDGDMTVWDLLKLCSIFDCDPGYLLGEYTCKRRQASDIYEKTGLNEKAVTTLLSMEPQERRFISDILGNRDFLQTIGKTYCQYRDAVKYYGGKNGIGLTTNSGMLQYERGQDGATMNVPLQDAPNYIRFDFMQEILNFIDREK